MKRTPVAMVIYRRPDLTRQVIDALRIARIEQLFVIADGPRTGDAHEAVAVEESRRLINEIDWECEVVRIYAETNLGLRERVLSGLDYVFDKVDKAIILEDDCVPNEDFYEFASEVLIRYSGEPQIAVVSANNFAPNFEMENSYYFASHPSIWGWATWSSAWKEFRQHKKTQTRGLSEGELKVVRSRMPGGLPRRAFLRMLDASPKLDSWALDFAVWCHLHGKLTVVPKVNLAKNIGFGRGSTHTRFESFVYQVSTERLRFPLRHPESIAIDYREMTRESRSITIKTLTFPLLHPFDFLGRIFRWAQLLVADSSHRR